VFRELIKPYANAIKVLLVLIVQDGVVLITAMIMEFALMRNAFAKKDLRDSHVI